MDSLVVFLLVVAFVVAVAFLVVKIAREYQRLVVFRLGRCVGDRGPGIVLLIPLVD